MSALSNRDEVRDRDELFGLPKQMRLSSQHHSSSAPPDARGAAPWERLQVTESAQGYELSLELAGVLEAKDLLVSVSDGVLNIAGTRRVDPVFAACFPLNERERPFQTHWIVPKDADISRLAWTFQDAVLTIQLPRRTPSNAAIKK